MATTLYGIKNCELFLVKIPFRKVVFIWAHSLFLT